MVLYFDRIMLNMSKIRQLLALVIVVATLALAAVIALKAYRGMRSAPVLPSLPKNIDLSLQKIHYTEIKEGVKKWEMVAEKADYDKVEDVVHLAGVRFDITRAGKAGKIILTAARAEYDTRKKDVMLAGNVQARSSSGIEFSTERIAYIGAQSLLRTTERVKFNDGNLKVEGVGMDFMVDEKTLKILRQVEASYSVGTSRR